MNNLILSDIINFEYSVLEEEKKQGKYILRGIFQKLDTLNENKRIYPARIFEREIQRLQDIIKERRMIGELDHPTTKKINLDRASHIITSLKIEGKNVLGEAEILLGMPYGNMLKALVDNNVKLGISSRGEGELIQQPDGSFLVKENYELITFDIVHFPSTPGAFPQFIKEEKENNNSERKIKVYFSLGSLIDTILKNN